MHYVRFLKPPKAYINNSHASVKALVTLTTDLGDEFFDTDLSLHAVVYGKSGSISEWTTVMWKAGMRTTWIEVKPLPLAYFNEILGLLVSSQHSIDADGISIRGLPEVVSARSYIASSKDPSAADKVERRLRTSNGEICIFEEMGESIARHIWDAAIALIAYTDQVAQMVFEEDVSLASLAPSLGFLLKTRNSEKDGLRIIELGSGCGITGTWMASTFPNTQVIMTDLPEAMENLSFNISQANVAAGSRVEKQVFDWSGELPEDIALRTFDLIAVSDCTYNCDSVPSLIKTFAALLARSSQALILISMKIRHESELVFFDLMSEAGIEKVEEASVLLPGTHQAADVYIFRAQR